MNGSCHYSTSFALSRVHFIKLVARKTLAYQFDESTPLQSYPQSHPCRPHCLHSLQGYCLSYSMASPVSPLHQSKPRFSIWVRFDPQTTRHRSPPEITHHRLEGARRDSYPGVSQQFADVWHECSLVHYVQPLLKIIDPLPIRLLPRVFMVFYGRCMLNLTPRSS